MEEARHMMNGLSVSAKALGREQWNNMGHQLAKRTRRSFLANACLLSLAFAFRVVFRKNGK
jgi:hypothetical protein